MERYKVGMLAESLAGHDAGELFVIIGSDTSYVYLADGKKRTVEKPKKKKKKHVQLIKQESDMQEFDDAAIRRMLKGVLKSKKES